MERILIIDDDPIIKKVYGNLFTKEGFAVEVAEDGEAAIERLGAHPPDLILLDLFLPKINGIGVLKHIRSKAATRLVPVIVFSNSSTTRYVDAAWKEGANKCLSKDDFDPIQLLQVVRTALEGVRKEKASAPKPSATAAAPSRPTPVPGADRQTFLANAPPRAFTLKYQAEALVEGFKTKTAGAAILDLVDTVKSLATDAGNAGFTSIQRFSSVYGNFLQELSPRPEKVTSSTVRTAAQAGGALALLLNHTGNQGLENAAPSLVLVITPQKTLQGIIHSTLSMPHLRAVISDDPFVALRLVEQNSFELILLDSNLHGLNIEEFCGKIRNHPYNRETPILLSLPASDFDSVLNAPPKAVNDLIALPFLNSELAVKACLHTAEGRLKGAFNG